jgi:hypothetical protein
MAHGISFNASGCYLATPNLANASAGSSSKKAKKLRTFVVGKTLLAVR